MASLFFLPFNIYAQTHKHTNTQTHININTYQTPIHPNTHTQTHTLTYLKQSHTLTNTETNKKAKNMYSAHRHPTNIRKERLTAVNCLPISLSTKLKSSDFQNFFRFMCGIMINNKN